jgi:hypothetical protein
VQLVALIGEILADSPLYQYDMKSIDGFAVIAYLLRQGIGLYLYPF